jgi:hypothetical protein
MRRSLGRALLSAVCLWAWTGSAAAEPSKAQCISANGNAQSLRRAGKLSEARAQLRMCMDPKCPGLVSADCVKRLDELESAQPTVVFDVKDKAGRDVSAVKVTVDGRPLADSLHGAALAVDPGEHSFAFSAASGKTLVTRNIVLIEGQKGRHESVQIDATEPAQTPGSPPVESASASAAPSLSSNRPTTTEASPLTASAAPPGSEQRLLGMVIGGFGVAGLAVSGVFGLKALTAVHSQKDNCSSELACPKPEDARSDHDAAEKSSTIANIAFAAGAGLVGAGLVVFFTAKHSEEGSTTVAVAPSAAPGALGLLVQGAF